MHSVLVIVPLQAKSTNCVAAVTGLTRYYNGPLGRLPLRDLIQRLPPAPQPTSWNGPPHVRVRRVDATTFMCAVCASPNNTQYEFKATARDVFRTVNLLCAVQRLLEAMVQDGKSTRPQ